MCTTDFDDNARVINDTVDMGADEQDAVSTVIKFTPPALNAFTLFRNYPNPFNPITVIAYRLEAGGFVNLSVYNLSGQKVRVLINEKQAAGRYSITFNAGSLPSGIYYYTLKTGNFVLTRRMILLQ